MQACAVAAQPGHTKELQTVQLERGIRIVDSPGVVFDDADDLLDSGGRARVRGSVLLRNVVKVEDVEDPIELGMMNLRILALIGRFHSLLTLQLKKSFNGQIGRRCRRFTICQSLATLWSSSQCSH